MPVRTDRRDTSTVMPSHTQSTSDTPAPQGKATDTTSSLMHLSYYSFMHSNFARLEKWTNKHEKQLKLLAEKPGPFIDRAIATTLEPYANVHTQMDAIEPE